MEDRAVPVHLVEEDHAGLAVSPRALNYLAEHLPGIQMAYHFHFAIRIAGIDRGPLRICGPTGDGLHELVADTDGDIEVVDVSFDLLAVDELQDVRVVHVHDGHVCAIPFSALRYEGGDGRQMPEHSDGAARLAVRGLDVGALPAQF